MIDLREQNLSPKEIGQVLFPGGMRGIPRPGTVPDVEKSVALDVLFEFDSANILPEYHAQLDKLGIVLPTPQYSVYRIQIEGHTDNIGSEHYNQRLSELRAENVKAYLVEHFNIDPTRLAVTGRGEQHPVVPNDTEDGRRKNRRLEVVSLGL
jgi:outer membrane protein OmpA-like peptidoglycan-associated protein